MMRDERIGPTDPRFLDFTVTRIDGTNYRVQFSEFDKKFILSLKDQTILEATSITFVFKPLMIIFNEYSREMFRLKVLRLSILTDWEWSRYIREPGRASGVITINIDNALKAKAKKAGLC